MGSSANTTIINLKEGMPTKQKALMRLNLQISTLKRVGIDCAKVIHGYGSTGKGGAIKEGSRDLLRKLLSEGKIKYFCAGEHFGPFEDAGRKIIGLKPDLRCDPDWAKNNEGITIVIL